MDVFMYNVLPTEETEEGLATYHMEMLPSSIRLPIFYNTDLCILSVK
jgi:hypothetical protein